MRILSQLHLLPIKYRIGFKILLMTDKAIHSMAPDYICKLISRRKSTGYSFRSCEKIMLEVPRDKYSQHLVIEQCILLRGSEDLVQSAASKIYILDSILQGISWLPLNTLSYNVFFTHQKIRT